MCYLSHTLPLREGDRLLTTITKRTHSSDRYAAINNISANDNNDERGRRVERRAARREQVLDAARIAAQLARTRREHQRLARRLEADRIMADQQQPADPILDQQAIQALIDAAVQAAVQQQQQLTNQLQQQLLATTQQLAAVQAMQIQAAQVAPAAQPVVFALSPGTAVGNADNLIDYRTKIGAEVAKQARAKLAVEHDLDKEHLNGFLEALKSRAIQQGWYDGIFKVTQDGVDLNIIESYGSLTKEAVERAVKGHIFAENRKTQDTINLFACLEDSLTLEAKETLYAESESYTYMRNEVQTPVPDGLDGTEKRRDGLMFLWTIINRTTARTNATISVIIHQLNHLESEMNEAGSDVKVFNTKVRKLLNSYYANKRQVFDEQVLLTNLADAYFTCKDNDFVDYMKRKWQDHIDETRTLKSTELMELALKQYQTMVEQKKWGVDSKQTKQIMTLASQVGNLRKWKSETEKKAKETTTQATNNSSGKKDGKPDGEKQFMNAKQWREQRYEKAPDWMKKKPDDLNKTITKKDKTYYWCTYHKLWQQHKSSDCRINPANRTAKTNGENQQQSNNSEKNNNNQSNNNNSSVRYKPANMMAEHDDNEPLEDDF